MTSLLKIIQRLDDFTKELRVNGLFLATEGKWETIAGGNNDSYRCLGKFLVRDGLTRLGYTRDNLAQLEDNSEIRETFFLAGKKPTHSMYLVLNERFILREDGWQRHSDPLPREALMSITVTGLERYAVFL